MRSAWCGARRGSFRVKSPASLRQFARRALSRIERRRPWPFFLLYLVASLVLATPFVIRLPRPAVAPG